MTRTAGGRLKAAPAPTSGPAASRYDHDREALASLLRDQPSYRVEQLWRGLYTDLADPADITTLPAGLRSDLATALPSALSSVQRHEDDDGATVKWLWRLADGALVETVLMQYANRSTVCISSQAGCAMACGFCATGQMGFERHLTVGEIVEQVVAARRQAGVRRLSNVVFMGMGEPLANYERTWAAVERIHGALGISARHVTISTVGIVPGILRLAGEALPVNLAVSLHAANDAKRDDLVPMNRRWPLNELADACRHHFQATGRRLSLEWALMHDVNDGPDDVEELSAYALALAAHVNLIPLNPTPGWPTRGSSRRRVTEFAEGLRRNGVNATIRSTRGRRIDAACGQLRAGQQPAEAATGVPLEPPGPLPD